MNREEVNKIANDVDEILKVFDVYFLCVTSIHRQSKSAV